ncbi:MAG: type II secretion system protein [Planctomycetota bacterium]|nr:type II secretion system protein [Planctomycetota bacterium]
MMKCLPPNSTASSPQAGFSLLELLIAIAVLSVSLVPALQSSIGSQRLSDQAEETRIAVAVLEEARLQLHGATPEDLTDAGGAFAVGQALNVAAALDASAVTYDLPNWVAGDPVPAVLPFRVTVAWTSAMDQPRTMTIVDAIR